MCIDSSIKKSKRTNIFIEEMIELIVDEKKILTFICSPEGLEELAIGFLYSKGIINSIEDIEKIKILSKEKKIKLSLKMESREAKKKNLVLATNGMTEYFREHVFVRKIKKQELINKETHNKIKKRFIQMLDEAELQNTKGGTHIAGILDGQGNLIIMEDIGRHNAVDKVIGSALIGGIDLSTTTLLITGRVSYDMMLKVLGGGIPCVGTLKVTSNLAIELAKKHNIKIIGRILKDECIVYT